MKYESPVLVENLINASVRRCRIVNVQWKVPFDHGLTGFEALARREAEV